MRQNRQRIYLDARGGFPKGFAPSAQWDTQNGPVGPEEDEGPAGTIFGVVAAEAGAFRSEGRGMFDEDSLRTLQTLWPAAGLPSHVQHPNALDDKTEMFLGRCKTPRRSLTTGIDEDGNHIAVPCIRTDLVFDSAARISPAGDLVKYMFQRVRNDPGSLSTSLVLDTDIDVDFFSRDSGAPLWTPRELFALDVVDCGDAVGGMLYGGGDRFTLRRLGRERIESLHRGTVAATKIRVPLQIDLEPSYSEPWQQWTFIDPAALRLSESNCVPVVDATGKAIASATLSHDDGQLFVSLNSTTKGRLSARADLDTSNARSETRLFRRPGHQLDNHRLTCFTSGVKLERIVVTAPEECFA